MEEDWKKYWRRNNKKEHNILPKIFFLFLTLLALAAYMSKNKLDFFSKDNRSYSDTLSRSDSQYIELIKTTNKQLEELLEYSSSINTKVKFNLSYYKEYDSLINNMQSIIDANTSNDISSTRLIAITPMKNMQNILNQKIITYNDYILLNNTFNTYSVDFMNVFENDLKENGKRYYRTDNEIRYFYEPNPQDM